MEKLVLSHSKFFYYSYRSTHKLQSHKITRWESQRVMWKKTINKANNIIRWTGSSSNCAGLKTSSAKMMCHCNKNFIHCMLLHSAVSSWYEQNYVWSIITVTRSLLKQACNSIYFSHPNTITIIQLKSPSYAQFSLKISSWLSCITKGE